MGIKLPSDPFENFPRHLGVQKLSPKFDWKQLKFVDRWEVTYGLPGLRVKGNEYYKFNTEAQANEFMMLKKLEQ